MTARQAEEMHTVTAELDRREREGITDDQIPDEPMVKFGNSVIGPLAIRARQLVDFFDLAARSEANRIYSSNISFEGIAAQLREAPYRDEAGDDFDSDVGALTVMQYREGLKALNHQAEYLKKMVADIEEVGRKRSGRTDQPG